MWSQGLILANMQAIGHGRKEIPDRSDLLKPQSIELRSNVKFFLARLIVIRQNLPIRVPISV